MMLERLIFIKLVSGAVLIAGASGCCDFHVAGADAMVSAIVGLRCRGINRISESLTVGQLPLVASLSGQRGIGVRLRPSVGVRGCWGHRGRICRGGTA